MINVSICTGTACYVMGASEILLLKEALPENLKDKVEITGLTCLEKCKDNKHDKAPFVQINGKIFSNATIASVLEEINRIAAIENL